MPKVLVQVEQETSHEDVIDILHDYMRDTPPLGVRLGPRGSQDGEEIYEGDTLLPKSDTYLSTPIAPETYVLVVQTIPRGGAFLGLFLTRDGQKGYAFFQGHQFEKKYNPL